MIRLSRNCFISIRKVKEDTGSLPVSLCAASEGIFAKCQDVRPKARARDGGDAGLDISLENVVMKWMMPLSMRPFLEKEKGRAKDSDMANVHLGKERVVRIILMGVTANV